MTDLTSDPIEETLRAQGHDPAQFHHRNMVAIRTGTRTEIRGDEPIAVMDVRPQVLHHGALRTSAFVNLVDILCPMFVDHGTEVWTFTSSITARMATDTPPPTLEGRTRTLRAGARSTTTEVTLTTPEGDPWGHAIASFSHVPRRPTDPPKPARPAPEFMAYAWSLVPPLEEDFRTAVGVQALDATVGRVEVPLFDGIRNPAGALHGAVTGLIAEASAEDFAHHHLGGPQLISELDVRYLSQARTGPVIGTSRWAGRVQDRIIVTELVDAAKPDILVATVTSRCVDAQRD